MVSSARIIQNLTGNFLQKRLDHQDTTPNRKKFFIKGLLRFETWATTMLYRCWGTSEGIRRESIFCYVFPPFYVPSTSWETYF